MTLCNLVNYRVKRVVILALLWTGHRQRSRKMVNHGVDGALLSLLGVFREALLVVDDGRVVARRLSGVHRGHVLVGRGAPSVVKK